MSLIQQALKRKLQEDMGGGAPPNEPPPLPDAATGGESPKKNLWGKLIVVVLILLVLGIAAAGLFFYAAKSWSQKSVLLGSNLSTGALPSKPVEPTQPSALKTHVDQTVETIKKTALDEKKSLDEAITFQPAATPPAVVIPPASVAGTPPTQTPVATPAATAPSPAEQTPGGWPVVTLNGLLASQRSHGAAIINNQLVNVNDHINGIRLVEVQDRGVTLEYQGEQKFILMGQSTR